MSKRVALKATLFEASSPIGTCTGSIEIERVITTDHSLQTQREPALPSSISNATQQLNYYTVIRLFFVIEIFLSLRLLTKIFHLKIFRILHISLLKKFLTKIFHNENFRSEI